MNRIRELRISSNLTQSELAERIGLNQSAIGKYERGELEPSISTLKALSKIFECSIDYILGNSNDFGVISIANEGAQLPTDAQELVDIYLALEEEYQAQILQYARYFADRRGIKTKKA